MDWICLNIKGSQTGREALVDVRNEQLKFTLRFKPNFRFAGCLENDLLSILANLQSKETPGRSYPIQDSIRSMIIECAERVELTFNLSERKPRADLVVRMITTSLGLQANFTDELTAYSDFCHSLYPVDRFLFAGERRCHAFEQMSTVPVESLQFLKAFDSFRGSAVKATIASDPATQLVYKGISFSDYLAFEDELFICRRDGIYREIELLCTIPPNPYIMAAPKALVVVDLEEAETGSGRVCGMLYPYYKNGSLAHALNYSVEQNIRISLAKKAKWCRQIVSGIYHVHSEGLSWHQDLKPPNIILDDEENIIIIDWEQGIGGTNTFISAPETYRDADAHYSQGEGSEILYRRYKGPPRINNAIGTPHWDVFPAWSVHCRKAVELAEVFSLGATMFLILEQVALEQVPGVEDYSTAKMAWSSESSDIPQAWKDTVSACTRENPNERISMKEVLAFWNNEDVAFGDELGRQGLAGRQASPG